MKPTAIHISNKEHHKWDDNASEPGPAGAVVDTTYLMVSHFCLYHQRM